MPAGVSVANKTGSLQMWENDAGIIYNTQNDLILSIYVRAAFRSRLCPEYHSGIKPADLRLLSAVGRQQKGSR